MVMGEVETGSVLHPKDLVQVLAFAYYVLGDLAKSFNFQSLCSCSYNMIVIITYFIAFICDA